MIIHFCAFLCVASEDNALVSCRERVMRFFDMSRERITRFFELSREMDPRTSSGKFLRVKTAIRKVLGFWASGATISHLKFLDSWGFGSKSGQSKKILKGNQMSE